MREGSYGTKTLKIVLDIMKRHEAKTRLLDLREIKMPIFNPNSSNGSADMNIQKVTDIVNWADAFVLASPDWFNVRIDEELFGLLLGRVFR